MTKTNDKAADRDLVLVRVIDAPRAAVWKAWSTPELLARWWAPLPYTVPHCDLDFRPGGTFKAVMRGPDGNEFPHQGIYLDVVPHERIVFTDAFVEAWTPSAKPFMTAIATFEDEGGKTKYTARVRHWTLADKEAHEAMGFHQGWSTCAEQLEALARTL